jgi:uncharacterized membrane protein YkvA (DUF1232 family)
MEGDIVRLPREGDDQPAEESDRVDQVVVMHPLDTAEPIPMRTKQEILVEGLLLVPNLAKLLYRLLSDPRVPRKRRLVMVVAGVYVASPVDLIPDAIPVFGSIDDLLVLAFAIDYLLRLSPPELVEEYWDGSEDGLTLVRGIAAWGVELIPGRLRRLIFIR